MGIPVPYGLKLNVVYQPDLRKTRYDYSFLFGNRGYMWSLYITDETIADDGDVGQITLSPLKQFWRRLGAM